MFIPIAIKTEHSLLNSMIRIPNLIFFLKEHNITNCGIVDDNLFSAIEFYTLCKKNNINPIIGLEIEINKEKIYLYAKDYTGFKNLLKINTLKQEREYNLVDLELYKNNIIAVLPYESYDLYNNLKDLYQVYLVYKNNYEKQNAMIITKNLVYGNTIRALDSNDVIYLDYLEMIKQGTSISNYQNKYGEDDYYKETTNEEDIKSTLDFASNFNLELPKQERYIPKYDESIKDEFAYLGALCKKGLLKRLDGNVPKNYSERLIYELSVIKNMGFVSYFLIVYDYIKFAKQNNILVGPGRGSAAGSLVSYCLGITEIDPLKYNLLFERFLNPDRITMPDIDTDFEDTRRDEVINYVKEKYGHDKVSLIMTYGTLGSRQVIRDVGKVLEIDSEKIDYLTKKLDRMASLADNLKNPQILEYVKSNNLNKVYKIGMKLEGLKRHISTHAAGVVISSKTLDEIIPVYMGADTLATGVTMNYLEDLGLLKMDFLAISHLTVIHNVLDLIKMNKGLSLDLKNINYNDSKVFELFSRGDTLGVFQFESNGMINFAKKLQPKSIFDLYAAVALFRPGPMQNIDSFIRRKEGKEKITYLHPSLEPILKETYGIIVYQEQIMQILVSLAGYTYAEADNIRRAMSKKKKEIILGEKDNFIKRAQNKGIDANIATEIYDLILKFANYGFNKAHSVCYAIIGYQMAYLKTYYPEYFITNLLNMSIGSDAKTNEYINMLKIRNLNILRPDINLSKEYFNIEKTGVRMPLSSIKGVGTLGAKYIIEERNKGEFKDFFNFTARCYSKNINKKTITALAYAGAFKGFDLNIATIIKNLDIAINYAEICHNLDESLVMEPMIEEVSEYALSVLIKHEVEVLGVYLTNHPASKYQTDIVKSINIKNYFDKFVKTIVVISKIRKITTKKQEEMAFITGSDEKGIIDFVIFPKYSKLLVGLNNDDLVMIKGRVEKRFDKYQINVVHLERL